MIDKQILKELLKRVNEQKLIYQIYTCSENMCFIILESENKAPAIISTTIIVADEENNSWQMLDWQGDNLLTFVQNQLTHLNLSEKDIQRATVDFITFAVASEIEIAKENGLC